MDTNQQPATSNQQRTTSGAIAEQVLAELRANLGGVWDDRISPEGREMARQAANDAAALLLAALASPRTPDADMALLRERAHLNAQLRNILAAEAARVSGAFWSAVQAVLRGAIGVALGSI